jgi:DNA-binding beta-propeller fold protein YncE
MTIPLAAAIGCRRQPPAPVRPLLVVLGRSENLARLVDPDSGEIRGQIATGVGPQEVVISGRLGIVTNHGSRENPGFSLTVLDLQAIRALRTLSLGRFRRPHGIARMKDGRRVVVACEGSRSLLVVNIESGRIEQAIPTTRDTTHQVVLSPDESRAWVADRDGGRVVWLDLTSSRLVSELKVGRSAEGIAISPDGATLWVADRAADRLVLLDPERFVVMNSLTCRESPVRLAFTPDGEHLLVTNTLSADLAVFSVRDLREVIRVPLGWTAEERRSELSRDRLSPVPAGIAIDPRWGRAFISHPSSGLVSVVDLRIWQVVRRLPAGERPDGLAYLSGDDLTA